MIKQIVAPILIGAFFINNIYASEQSVFGAGNLEEASPYGLTQSEKVALKNKKNVDNLGQNVDSVKIQVGTIEERIDGIYSVIDGINERLNLLDKKARDIENNRIEDINASKTIKQQLQNIRNTINKNKQIQDENNKKITTLLAELSALIDTINTNYVSKDEFKNQKLEDENITLNENNNSTAKIVDDDNKIDIKTENKEQAIATKNTIDLEKFTPKEIFEKANILFDNNKHEEAREYFVVAIKKHHRPAFANFKLGEIEYKNKKWAEAVKYYKISVELYDKADYMPKLLYHTAISFDKLGDKTNANKFYKALKLAYPDSQEAKVSPERK